MKRLVILMILGTLALVACPNRDMNMADQNMGCAGKYRSGGLLATLHYALDEMDKSGDADIRLAVQSYKMDMAGMKRGINMNAFKDGKFDKELYLNESHLKRKLQAQVDLFETIYLILNDEEKKHLNTFMREYQDKPRSEDGMNANMCPHKGDVPKICPKNEKGCSHCQTKCQCEDKKECQCKKDCTCPKCKAKREK